MIDNVYILNLPREIKRCYVTEGGLLAKGVPLSKINVWVANDDRDYEKTRHVCEAAIADGFPEFQVHLDNGWHNNYNIGLLTQTWNYCRFFRYLADIDETVLLIHDEMKLGMEFDHLVGMTAELQVRDPHFMYLTLWMQYPNRERLPLRTLKENPDIARGLYEWGSDMAQVMNSKCARLFFDKMGGYSDLRSYYPTRFEQYVSEVHYDTTGFYTLVNNDLQAKRIAGDDSRHYVPSRILNRVEGKGRFCRDIEDTKD